MRLLLNHREVAAIDCRDCHRFIYNLTTGKRSEYDRGDGEMIPIARAEPPPCWSSCPKGEYDPLGKKVLSSRNRQALSFYLEQRAMPSLPIPKHFEFCAVFAANMRLIESVYDEAKLNAAKNANAQSGE